MLLRIVQAVTVIVVVIAMVFLLEWIFHTDSITGKVTKLWIQGRDNYAVIETTNGTRQSIVLFSTQYGILDIGMTCTFHVDHTM